MKKYKIINIFLFLIFVFSFFIPSNILKKNDSIRIDRIVYNKQFESDENNYNRIEIENFNSDEVVECISEYKSYLTLTRATGYQIKNSEIEVFLTLNGKGKHIVLGNINYEISSDGVLRKNIINAKNLTEELKQLLNLNNLKGNIRNEENN